MSDPIWQECGDGIAVLASVKLTAEERGAMREYIQWCRKRREAERLGISVEALDAITNPPKPEPKPITGGIQWPLERPTDSKEQQA